MGITINDFITTSYGHSVINSYASITGIYRIEKREVVQLGNSENSFETKSYTYVLCSTANIYISKQCYIDMRLPIMYNINLEHITNITELQEADLYSILYSRLKETIRREFGNHITMTDDI